MSILEDRDFEVYKEPEPETIIENKKKVIDLDESNKGKTNEIEQNKEVIKEDNTTVDDSSAEPASTIMDRTAEAKKVERPEGVITQIGKGLEYTLTGGLTRDYVNAVAAFWKDRTQGIPVVEDIFEATDNFFLSTKEAEELEAKIAKKDAEKRARGEDDWLDKTQVVLDGIASGMEGGLALPFTLAGRLTNQATPWADPPETLKDSPLGQTVFEIMQVVTPTLLFGAVGGGGTGAVGAGTKGTIATGTSGLLIESGIETVTQDAADDLIAGRWLATRFGIIANSLGFDGDQLAIDMIEGKNFRGQAFVATVGFLQNLGINYGVNKFVDLFKGSKKAAQQKLLEGGGGENKVVGQKQLPTSAITTQQVIDVDVIDVKELPPNYKHSAKVLKTDAIDVYKKIEDINEVPYNHLKEPHDVMDIDNSVNVSKPSDGNAHISSESFHAEMGRSLDVDTPVSRGLNEIGGDGLTAADRNYFSNWKAITDEGGVVKALQELTSNLRKLKGFPADLDIALKRANHFWSKNSQLLGEDITAFAREFYKEGVVPLDPRKSLNDFDGIDWQRVLRENAKVAPDFFAAAGLMAEELGVRFAKQARVVRNLDKAGIDFTQAMENMVQLVEKGDLLLIPLRRAKRQWAVEGITQQKNFFRKIREGYKGIDSAKLNDLPTDATSPRDLTLIKKNDTDAGKTLRELWESAKAGDSKDLETLKEYLDYVAMSPPDEVFGMTKNLSDALKQTLEVNGDTVRTLYYAKLLATVNPQTAAGATNVARLIAEPLGNIVSPLFRGSKSNGIKDVLYGLGQLVGTQSAINDALFAFKRAAKTNQSINASSRVYELSKTWKRKSLELDAAKTMLLDKIAREGGDKTEIAKVHINYWMNWAVYNPYTNFAKRFLIAQDDAANVMVGQQEAVGRAFVKAWEDGVFNIKINPKNLFKKGESVIQQGKQLERYVRKEMGNIFEDGITHGRLVDEGVISRAKNLTMQENIPVGKYATPIDNFFKGLEQQSQNAFIATYFMPFARLSWNFLDSLGRSLYSLDPTGLMEKSVPRYKAIISGEMGEVAEMQLKSQVAFTRLFVMSNAGLAMTGNITGNYPPDGLPKNSFILPTPWTSTGYTAIPHDRIQPFSSIAGITADLVVLTRDKAISEKKYLQAVSMFVATLGVAALDQTFLRGLQNQTDYLDLNGYVTRDGRNLKLSRVGADLSMNIPHPYNPMFWAGFSRQLFDLVQPYQTMNSDPNNAGRDYWARVKGRVFMGLGNPLKYDRYTGNAIKKSGSQGKGYFTGIVNNLFNTFGYAGKITEADPDNFVKKQMYSVGFDFNKPEIAQYKGLELTNEEQSSFNKYMFSEGKIEGRLKFLFTQNKKYKKLYAQYKRMKENSPINMPNTELAQVEKQLHAMITAVHKEAKDAALPFVIMDHPELKEKHAKWQALQVRR